MFVPLKFGLARTSLGADEYLVKCPHCETDQWADVLVSGVYTHLYYIPLYPTDKDAMVICKNCGLKRDDVPLTERQFSNYRELKKRYRHRWFTYTGVGIVSLPFVLWILLVVLSK